MQEKLKKEIIKLINSVLETDSFDGEGELDIDSLRLMEIVVGIERKYQIKIKEKDLMKMDSLPSVVDMVEKKIKAGKRR